jgi:hypothetical protein
VEVAQALVAALVDRAPATAAGRVLGVEAADRAPATAAEAPFRGRHSCVRP